MQDMVALAPELEVLGLLLLSSLGNCEPYAWDHHTDNMRRTIYDSCTSSGVHNVHTPTSVVAFCISIPPFVSLVAGGMEQVSFVL